MLMMRAVTPCMVESIMQLMLMMRAVVAIHVAANQNKLILTTHAVPPDNGNSVRQLMQTMRAVAAIQDSKTIRPADADDARRGPVHGGKSEAADADDARRRCQPEQPNQLMIGSVDSLC